MIHLARRAGPLGVVLALFLGSPASAAEVVVTVYDNYFSPGSITIRQGDTVTWIAEGSGHSTTGNHPLNYWSSDWLFEGYSYSFVFTAAGTFPYHCALHGWMTGTVTVNLWAAPRAGPVGTNFVVRLATEDPVAPFVFDVQRKAPGGDFHDWKTGLTSKRTNFDSAGAPTGTYQFRSRVRNTSTGGVSDWSPPTSIRVR